MNRLSQFVVAGSGRFRELRPARESGLTIVELILVIVIIGILGALAGPRFFDNRSFDERAYAEELASALRYAQKIAVGSGCRVRVDIAPASYSLMQQDASAGHCDPTDTSFPAPVLLSTGQTASGTAPSGVTTATSLTIVFDPLGRTNLGSNRSIAFGPHTLTLQADSGLVTGP